MEELAFHKTECTVIQVYSMKSIDFLREAKKSSSPEEGEHFRFERFGSLPGGVEMRNPGIT